MAVSFPVSNSQIYGMVNLVLIEPFFLLDTQSHLPHKLNPSNSITFIEKNKIQFFYQNVNCFLKNHFTNTRLNLNIDINLLVWNLKKKKENQFDLAYYLQRPRLGCILLARGVITWYFIHEKKKEKSRWEINSIWNQYRRPRPPG